MAQATPAATYERAKRLANIAMWTVSLQCRRLRAVEPEDEKFVFRRWADFDFLIVALIRLRRAVKIAAGVPVIAAQIDAAIAAFDQALPNIKKQRDIAEHIDEYAIDSGRRHDKTVERYSLEVGAIGDDSFEWLGHELSITTALQASEALFAAVQAAKEAFPKVSGSA